MKGFVGPSVCGGPGARAPAPLTSDPGGRAVAAGGGEGGASTPGGAFEEDTKFLTCVKFSTCVW